MMKSSDVGEALKILAEEMPPALGFFLVEEVSSAYSVSDWTIIQEAKILAEIAKDADEDAQVRMGAITMLRKHLRDSAILSGYIGQIEGSIEHTDALGTRTTTHVQSTIIVPPGTDTMTMLTKGLETSEVLVPESDEKPVDNRRILKESSIQREQESEQDEEAIHATSNDTSTSSLCPSPEGEGGGAAGPDEPPGLCEPAGGAVASPSGGDDPQSSDNEGRIRDHPD